MSLTKKIVLVLVVVMAGLLMAEAIRLLILKRSLATYSQYWREQAAQTPAENSLLYMALGDSTAQGIGASKPQKGYVGLIRKNLEVKAGVPVHVINLSTSGAKIQDLIDNQLPKLQQMNLPNGTVVTVSVGANDLGDFDKTKFTAQVEQLLSQLPPQTVVADLPYFGGGRAKNKEPSAVIASEIIASAAARHHLVLAPLHDSTKAGDRFAVYGADFFHPSDKGYQNWYKAFAKTLSL